MGFSYFPVTPNLSRRSELFNRAYIAAYAGDVSATLGRAWPPTTREFEEKFKPAFDGDFGNFCTLIESVLVEVLLRAQQTRLPGSGTPLRFFLASQDTDFIRHTSMRLGKLNHVVNTCLESPVDFAPPLTVDQLNSELSS
eukprot:m51a1_g1624 hypothetical protein (140) ;mRNA; r:251029-251498